MATASKNKYAIYSNNNANSLDIQIESVGGSMRVTNGLDTRFKIDYLGNTIFSGSNVGFSNCISFGPGTPNAVNTFCPNATKNGLDMSGPIRMTGNLQLDKGIVMDGSYVGPMIERRDMSDRYGMSTTANETRMYAGNSTGGKVSLGFADASGYTSRLTIPQSGAATFAGDIQLMGSGQLSASQLTLGEGHSLIPKGNWLHGGSIATSRFTNDTSATFNGTADFANGIKLGTGASIGVAPYGSVARFHGSQDATTQLALGFRGVAPDSWDDRISITNSPQKVDIKGDVNITDGGTLSIGNYKFGVINNKLTIRDPNGTEVWSVPSSSQSSQPSQSSQLK